MWQMCAHECIYIYNTNRLCITGLLGISTTPDYIQRKECVKNSTKIKYPQAQKHYQHKIKPTNKNNDDDDDD